MSVGFVNTSRYSCSGDERLLPIEMPHVDEHSDDGRSPRSACHICGVQVETTA